MAGRGDWQRAWPARCPSSDGACIASQAGPPCCVPHLDGTSASGLKASATPLISSDGNLAADQNDPNLLARDRLCGPVDVFIDQHGDNRISACHRMVGEKDDRFAARWYLD
jgi:hypothetical protein